MVLWFSSFLVAEASMSRVLIPKTAIHFHRRVSLVCLGSLFVFIQTEINLNFGKIMILVNLDRGGSTEGSLVGPWGFLVTSLNLVELADLDKT